MIYLHRQQIHRTSRTWTVQSMTCSTLLALLAQHPAAVSTRAYVRAGRTGWQARPAGRLRRGPDRLWPKHPS